MPETRIDFLFEVLLPTVTVRNPVTASAGTFGLMVAFPLFLMSHDRQFSLRHVAGVLAWLSVIPALLFAWYAAITYVPMARKALQEGRAGRVDSMVT